MHINVRYMAAAICATCLFSVAFAETSLPPFHAVSLTGDTITAEKLIGEPGILIVTPGKGAAADTRAWAEALRKDGELSKLRIDDVLAVNLPFFMSEKDAIEIARKKIPSQYYDQTWLLMDGQLQEGMNIPATSEDSFVFVLDAEGRVKARIQGKPTAQHIAEIRQALTAASQSQ